MDCDNTQYIKGKLIPTKLIINQQGLAANAQMFHNVSSIYYETTKQRSTQCNLVSCKVQWHQWPWGGAGYNPPNWNYGMKQNHPRGEPPGRSSRSSSPKRAENISPIQGAAPDTAVTNGQINRHDCTIFPAKLIRLAIIPYHGGSNPEYSGNNNNPNDHQKSYLQLYSVQQIS